MLGSAVVLCWSLSRVFRFQRLLSRHTYDAPNEVVERAQSIAAQLGMGRLPRIRITSASITPMVWWIGGRVNVILPATILEKMSPEEWRWALAHELGHVKRRDFLVRWIEWSACVLFWWNPVIWLAQRRLRIAEEICCDQLVLSKLNPEPHTYANSILTVVESLMSPVHRPPAMASEINSGGNLENRMKLIVHQNIQRRSRLLHACVVLAAVAILPLGIVYGHDKNQDPRDAKYNAVETEILKALENGKITAKQAQQKLIAVRTDLYAKKKESPARQGDDDHHRRLRNAVEAKARKDLEERPAVDRARKTEYQAFEAEMKRAVKEGKLSPEESTKRMTEFRQKLWPGKGKSFSTGEFEIEADAVDYDSTGKLIKARGKVHIKNGLTDVYAQEADYDVEAGIVQFRNQVSIFKDGVTYKGEAMIYNTNTGEITAQDLRTGMTPRTE